MPSCVFVGGKHICAIVFVAVSVHVCMCHGVYTWDVDGQRSGCVSEVEIHEYGSG